MPFRWGVPTDGIDGQFKADIEARLGPSPYGWVGYRAVPPPGAQAALSAAYQAHPDTAPEAAPPGESAHEFGLGADVRRDNPEHEFDYETDPAWPWLWAAIEADPNLHSGHDFPKPDDDHIEAYRWAHATSAGTSYIAKLKARGLWGVDPRPHIPLPLVET